MNSMTGFGRGEADGAGHRFTVEIKSVNHRYLDINVRTPRALLFLEETVRAKVKERLVRGRVDVFINYSETAEAFSKVKVNLEAAKAYVAAAKEIADATGAKDDLTTQALMRMDGVLAPADDEKDLDAIQAVMVEALDIALDGLVNQRAAEGMRMKGDLKLRRDNLAELLANIEVREPLVVEEYKEKLHAKLEEYMGDTAVLDENRFEAEVLYFTDKASITEELVRIASHLIALDEEIAKTEPIGRSMDFLVQELNREFNTIGSKASDIEITQHVLAGKAEIEKIREQVQNLE